LASSVKLGSVLGQFGAEVATAVVPHSSWMALISLLTIVAEVSAVVVVTVPSHWPIDQPPDEMNSISHAETEFVPGPRMQ
jgi:hypothetical protein